MRALNSLISDARLEGQGVHRAQARIADHGKVDFRAEWPVTASGA